MLKGPAAVLYGRGSTGGIVNRVSKVPQKGWASSVSAQVGSFDSRRFAADLNGEAGEQVAGAPEPGPGRQGQLFATT